MKGKISIACIALAVAGCGGPTVNVVSNYDKAFDFETAHTYQFADVDPQTIFPPQAKDPVGLDARIKKAVEWELQERGLERSDSPDLLVAYRVQVEDKVAVSAYAYSSEWDPNRDLSKLKSGALVVDLVDAKTNYVVWRGGALADFEVGKGADVVDPAVRKIFAEFPPKK